MRYSRLATATAVVLMNPTAYAYQDGDRGSPIRTAAAATAAVNNVQPVVVDYGPHGGPFGSLSQCSVYHGDSVCAGHQHLPKYRSRPGRYRIYWTSHPVLAANDHVTQ